MDLAALKSELDNDPEAIGYSAMSDVEAAEALNARDREADADTLQAGDLVASLGPDDWVELAAEQKQYLQLLVTAGSCPLTAVVKSTLAGMFPAQSQTRRNLLRIMRQEASRAKQLSLGRVTPSDVADARRL